MVGRHIFGESKQLGDFAWFHFSMESHRRGGSGSGSGFGLNRWCHDGVQAVGVGGDISAQCFGYARLCFSFAAADMASYISVTMG